MISTEEHINYVTKGRYFTHGDPEKANHLIIALHGYGQLASYFIRKFNLLPESYFIICPEAPHRFYQENTSGRVGASWMTKEDRLNDIANYISFLDAIYTSFDSNYIFDKTSLVGFSQGGATASRWIGLGCGKFDNFLLWSAVFPPDMPIETIAKFENQRNYFVIGDQDEFTSLEQALEYHMSLNEAEMNFEFIKFAGNHSINVPLLQSLIQ